jgi:hypothetical protein
MMSSVVRLDLSARRIVGLVFYAATINSETYVRRIASGPATVTHTALLQPPLTEEESELRRSRQTIKLDAR